MVAMQMYRRDKDTPLTPLGVLLDDRLPPSPEGWWTDTDDLTRERNA